MEHSDPLFPPLNYTRIVLRLEEVGEMNLDGMSGKVRADFPARLCREVVSCTQGRVTLLLTKPDDGGALEMSMDAEKQALPVQFGRETYGTLIFVLSQQEHALQEQEFAGTRSIAKTCAELLRHFELASMVFIASPLPGQLAIASLTRRQLQVLRLICQGWSEPEIARQLHLRLSTVEKHRQQAYNKLGATNHLDARRIAFRARLFSLISDTQNTSD
jgi:DNA-binding CsgD family transcriptional regulator